VTWYEQFCICEVAVHLSHHRGDSGHEGSLACGAQVVSPLTNKSARHLGRRTRKLIHRFKNLTGALAKTTLQSKREVCLAELKRSNCSFMYKQVLLGRLEHRRLNMYRIVFGKHSTIACKET
jgi:hypothetical protein